MPKYDTIIRNGAVVRESGVEVADVAIDDGKFVEIAPQIVGDARETIDATDLHVFPGVIDPHVHFNEPGRTEWEGFATGSAALAAGGGTCFFDMPLNSSPPVLDGESFDLKLAAANAKSLTDFALWGGLTPDNLDKLEQLAERGVIGFKAFMCDSGIDDFPRADPHTLYRGMELAAAFGLPVAVHAEDPETLARAKRRAARAGLAGIEAFLASRPMEAERRAIVEAVHLASQTGCSLHVVHLSISAEDTVHLGILTWKATVTSETCPHYLLLDENDLQGLGSLAKCAPPLRDAGVKATLWKDLLEGRINFVASDHSPAPPSMKTGRSFDNAWGGIAGVQSTLPILLSHEPPLPHELIAKLTATNAASRFRVEHKGRIAPGYDADLALVDVNARYELTRETLLDRHKLSPYVGRMFHGLVRRTFVRGATVFLDGKIVSEPIGRLVKPG